MAKTDCVVTHQPEQVAASRTFFKRGRELMLPFQLEIPPGIEVSQPTHVAPVGCFAGLYALALILISFLLPRPWFVALFRMAFPWMPERLEDFDE